MIPCLQKARTNQELGDAVILDCDTNTVTTEYDDLGDLPPEVVSEVLNTAPSLLTVHPIYFH